MPKATHIKKLALPSAIIVFALVVFVLLFISRPKVEATPIVEKTWGVAVIPAQPATLAPRIKLFGKVESGQLANIKAAVIADIVNVYVKEGHHVNKGDLLLQLDDHELALVVKQRQAEIAELDAEIRNDKSQFETDKSSLAQESKLLEFATKEFKRAQSLQQDKLATQSLIDSTQQNVLRGELALGQRQLKINKHDATTSILQARRARLVALKDLALFSLNKTKILAPFAGKVVNVSAVTGDRTQIGQSLVNMYSDSSIEIRAHIPNTYAIRFQSAQTNNQAIIASLASAENIQFKLDRLSVGHVDSGGIIDAFFIPAKPIDQLSLGLTVELDIAMPAMDNIITIPREAIYGSNLIYLYDNGRMRSAKVDRVGEYVMPPSSVALAKQQSQQILIQSNHVQPNDKIVITQIPNAVDGLRIKILE